MGPDITVITMLARGLREEYPHVVANYYRFSPVTNVVSAGDRFFMEDIAIGDTTLVSMYDFKMIQGNPEKAFENTSSAVITEPLAKKLFDTENAVGRTISVQTTNKGVKQDFLVSSVLADIPVNSVTHITGANYSSFLPITGNQYFGNADFFTYWDHMDVIGFVELQPGKTIADLQRSIDQILKKNAPDYIWNNMTAYGVPVADYHLKDNNGALSKLIMAISMIAIFVLIMVVINFVNITIGRSAGRLKEIALKKAFGSGKFLIIRQFIVETLLLTIAASGVALLIYQGSRVSGAEILQTQFPVIWKINIQQWLYLILLTVALSLLAGIYPAIILSKTNLINSVKGTMDGSKGGLVLRRALLVVQFSLAVFVFICALNISKQVKYIFSKDLGYDKEQVLIVTALPQQWDSAGVDRMKTIKNSMLELSGIKKVSIAFDIPDQVPSGKWEVLAPKSSSPDRQITLSLVTADEDYAKTMGLKIVNGNFFQDGKDGIILNESAVRQLGETPEKIIGKKIKTIAGDDGITVRGVVKDYNYSSLQDKIAPVGFLHLKSNNTYKYLVIKLGTDHISQSLQGLREKWKAMLPNTPFNYTFMDEKFNALYKSETQMREASVLAALLSFLIVLLGITGVVAFMLQRKVKEIAVRKLLGAGTIDIIVLFVKEYLGLISVANVIAWPVSYLVSERMLQQFAYRIDQTPISYLMALAIVAAISLLMVAAQCYRSASANPAASLKIER
jgi:ABC-type antimicrobial peptide transport system permease subunit